MDIFDEQKLLLDGSEKSFKKVRDYCDKKHIPILRLATEQLITNLIMQKQPKTILEIGTAIGFSGTVMLLNSKATLYTIDIDENMIAIAKKNFLNCGFKDRVTIFPGDCKEIIPKITGQYDFIFLDGPKGQYLSLFPYLKELLVVGGVLVCDNVLYRGLTENPPSSYKHKHVTIANNLNEFLRILKQDRQLNTEIYDFDDGVSVSIKTR